MLQPLLRAGIAINVGEMNAGLARVGIEAPKEILILRDELIGKDEQMSTKNGTLPNLRQYT